MPPRVLILGELFWAHKECKELLGSIATVTQVSSKSRQEFFSDLAPGGRYDGTVGIFHEHLGGKAMVGELDDDFISSLPDSCKFIAHRGAGYDSIAVKTAKRRGIFVSNTPGAVDEATATTAVYLTIGAMRNFAKCAAVLRSGGFAPIKEVENSSFDLSGKTIGVLGMGGIGSIYANIMRGFGVKVIYHNRNPSPKATPDMEYIKDLYDFLSRVDVLSVHMPLSPKTTGFVGEKEIRTMKKGSRIVNTARGKVIDEEALLKALQDGHLGGAGLDVFKEEPKVDPRFLKLDNVLLLPHVGTENQDARRKMEVVALTNLRDFITSGAAPNIVPETQ